MTASRLFTLTEAASYLRCSRRTLERRIAAGLLAVYRDGRKVAVPELELQRYVAERTVRLARKGEPGRRNGRPLSPESHLWD